MSSMLRLSNRTLSHGVPRGACGVFVRLGAACERGRHFPSMPSRDRQIPTHGHPAPAPRLSYSGILVGTGASAPPIHLQPGNSRWNFTKRACALIACDQRRSGSKRRKREQCALADHSSERNVNWQAAHVNPTAHCRLIPDSILSHTQNRLTQLRMMGSASDGCSAKQAERQNASHATLLIHSVRHPPVYTASSWRRGQPPPQPTK